MDDGKASQVPFRPSLPALPLCRPRTQLVVIVGFTPWCTKLANKKQSPMLSAYKWRGRAQGLALVQSETTQCA